MRYIQADVLYTLAGEAVKNGTVALDDSGEIKAVYNEGACPAEAKPERYEGAVVPGFINMHCHLELSHLKDKFERGTGLVSFLKNVISSRQADEQEIVSAMLQADAEMRANGIKAVADIANQPASKGVKQQSNIYYYTLVEVLGFNPAAAEQLMARGRAVLDALSPLPGNITPHAPYTVSDALFTAIKERMPAGGIYSIHNQESAEEDLFYKSAAGGFTELYDFLKQDISHFKARGLSSLMHYKQYLPADAEVVLVHNTYTTAEDAADITAEFKNVWFCLCPHANLFIEGKMPPLPQIEAVTDRIVLGTDSLASNGGLNILDEMMALQEAYGTPLHRLLKYAAYNGAHALGMADRLGSLQPGMRPGLNLIQVDAAGRLAGTACRVLA